MSDTLDDITMMAVHRHNHSVDEITLREAEMDEDQLDRESTDAFRQAADDVKRGTTTNSSH